MAARGQVAHAPSQSQSHAPDRDRQKNEEIDHALQEDLVGLLQDLGLGLTVQDDETDPIIHSMAETRMMVTGFM